jgi:HAMP domain-containing protein
VEVGDDTALEAEPSKRPGLAARLGLLFLAVGLLPLGVTMLVLAPRGQDALRTSAKLLLEAKVDALRARVDGALDDLLADVRLLATPLPAGEATERKALLRFLLEKHQELTCVTLFDGTRKLPGGQAYDRSLVGAADVESHELKAAALLDGKPTGLRASDFYPSRRGREMLVTFVTPFGEAGGYLAAEVSLKRVQGLIAEARVGRRGGAYIIDGDGRLVAHPILARALAREDLSLSGVAGRLKDNIARQATTGRPVTVVSDFVDEGIEQVGAYSPLGRLRWGLVVAEPRDDAYGLARATWAHALGWVSLALALALVVAFLFARGITRPVARLVEGTKVLARGSFGIAVPVEGTPEIAELARTFNEASRQLSKYDSENRELLAAVERGYLETLRALVNAIEAKDPYTAGHSQRTAEVAVAIAETMKLSEEQITEIEFGGLLHDIGKIGIAEQILRKPAVLDDNEMKIMRGHPDIGDAIMHDIDLLKKIRPMVRNHHERFDGSGYPDGLKGEEIPLGARIIAAADTYDAITSDRCYQPGRSPKEALPILKRLSGVTLDNKVVDALYEALVLAGALTLDEIAAAPADGVIAHLPALKNPATMDDDRPRRPTLEFQVNKR